MDDLAIFGQTFEEHLSRLEQILVTLAEVNMKMNPKKCFFGMKEIEYLGFIIGAEGVKPNPNKIEKVVNFQRPTCITQLRSFLGLCSYYRNFVNGFSKTAHPLYQLLKTDADFIWTTECQIAFEKLKESLVNYPILTHYDIEKEQALFVDTSAKGIGAILKQLEQDDNGKEIWRVIAYWGRSLLPAETRYPATHLELLGLANACNHFRCYIQGKRVKVFTDHRALLALSGKGLCANGIYNRRVNSLQLRLADFDLDVIYKPGAQHLDADALSRMDQEVEDGPDGDEDRMFLFRATGGKLTLDDFKIPAIDFKGSQARDVYCKYKIYQLLSPNSRANRRFVFFKSKELLYRKIKKKGEPVSYSLVVPQECKNQVLSYFHDSHVGGHKGIRKTRLSIRKSSFWWPKLNTDVEKYVRTCNKC